LSLDLVQWEVNPAVENARWRVNNRQLAGPLRNTPWREKGRHLYCPKSTGVRQSIRLNAVQHLETTRGGDHAVGKRSREVMLENQNDEFVPPTHSLSWMHD